MSDGSILVHRVEPARFDLQHVKKLGGPVGAIVDPPAVLSRPPLLPKGQVVRKKASVEAAVADMRMIGNIAKEMTRPPNLTVLERKGPMSLNVDRRRKELHRIDAENEKMLKRLESVRSGYSKRAQDRSYVQSRRHVALASATAARVEASRVPPAAAGNRRTPRRATSEPAYLDSSRLQQDDGHPTVPANHGAQAGLPRVSSPDVQRRGDSFSFPQLPAARKCSTPRLPEITSQRSSSKEVAVGGIGKPPDVSQRAPSPCGQRNVSPKFQRPISGCSTASPRHGSSSSRRAAACEPSPRSKAGSQHSTPRQHGSDGEVAASVPCEAIGTPCEETQEVQHAEQAGSTSPGTSRQEVGSPNSGNQAVAEEARQGKGKDAAETHEEQLEQAAASFKEGVEQEGNLAAQRSQEGDNKHEAASGKSGFAGQSSEQVVSSEEQSVRGQEESEAEQPCPAAEGEPEQPDTTDVTLVVESDEPSQQMAMDDRTVTAAAESPVAANAQKSSSQEEEEEEEEAYEEEFEEYDDEKFEEEDESGDEESEENAEESVQSHSTAVLEPEAHTSDDEQSIDEDGEDSATSVDVPCALSQTVLSAQSDE